MADEEFDLTTYLNEGVEDIVKRALRATLPNAKESAYLATYALASRRFGRLRQKQKAQGMAPSEGTEYLAPGAADRLYLEERLDDLRDTFEDMIVLAFPGEEKVAGGCLAGGRGFIHINSRGDAEPCPFSPHSGINVREVGVAGALQSDLFRALREGGLLTSGHDGGCVLFKRDAQVLELMSAEQMRSRHAR